jgi:hypothetical protein
MLNPAGLRINLLKFALGDGNDVGVMIQDHGTRAGRPLIERDNVFFFYGHNSFLMV